MIQNLKQNAIVQNEYLLRLFSLQGFVGMVIADRALLITAIRIILMDNSENVIMLK